MASDPKIVDSAFCRCKSGYEGDGETCTPIEGPVTCADLTCGNNATCHVTAAAAECRCNTGYAGDGQTCTPSGEPCPSPAQRGADGTRTSIDG